MGVWAALVIFDLWVAAYTRRCSLSLSLERREAGGWVLQRGEGGLLAEKLPGDKGNDPRSSSTDGLS